MQQSSYLPGNSENWNTNWARDYLKISEDQLNKLESIPEWIPVASLEKVATVNKEITACVLQEEPLLQGTACPENLNKEPIEKKNLCPKGRKRIQKGIPMDSDFDISLSYSQPEMGSYKSVPVFPKPLEKLSENILSHRFLKPSTLITNEPETVVLSDVSKSQDPKASETGKENGARPELSEKETPISSDVEVPKPADEEESGKKSTEVEPEGIAVIEENRRGKPGVESGAEVTNSKRGTAANVVEDSFRCESIPCGQPVSAVANPSSSPINSSAEVANKQGEDLAKVNAPPVICDAEVSKPADDESGNKNSRKSLESEVDKVIEENRVEKPDDEANGKVPNSKTDTSQKVAEDSFRCESLPCGQPVADPSSSPINSSGEDANKQREGLEKVDASAGVQTLDKAKGNLLSFPQSGESSGASRKRKSKGESPKNLKDAKRSRNLSVRFTSDQVKQMLEILRLAHSK